MHLVHASLRGVAPFGDLDVDFCDDRGDPRMVTVVHGAAGVGKTMLLRALASTRPGHTTVVSTLGAAEVATTPHVRCAWWLGEDERARPHPLKVCTPGRGRGGDEAELQRREQALFDRKARDRGGFVFILFPANRWFSRQALSLHNPRRSMMRYDVRATTSFDQTGAADLTRETKQALAYAAMTSALAPRRQADRVADGRLRTDPRRLGRAMHDTVDELVRLAGFRYEGLDPLSLEPRFTRSGGRGDPMEFDALPTGTQHLVAVVAITVRTLWAAYPQVDPRSAEAVVAIDDADLYLSEAMQAQLLRTLRGALLGVQWILTTASAQLAASASPGQVLALRRLSQTDPVDLFVDSQACTH